MIIQIVNMISKDQKRPQMTLRDLKILNSLNPNQTQTLLLTAQWIGKTNWKVDACLSLVLIKNENLVEILHINNL